MTVIDRSQFWLTKRGPFCGCWWMLWGRWPQIPGPQRGPGCSPWDENCTHTAAYSGTGCPPLLSKMKRTLLISVLSPESIWWLDAANAIFTSFVENYPDVHHKNKIKLCHTKKDSNKIPQNKTKNNIKQQKQKAWTTQNLIAQPLTWKWFVFQF